MTRSNPIPVIVWPQEIKHMAYIKPAKDERGEPAFSIHNGITGEPLAIIGDRATAFETVRWHNLIPVSVH